MKIKLLNHLCCCFPHTPFTKPVKTTIKNMYLSYILFSSLILFLMTIKGESIINLFAKFMDCPKDQNIELCLGISLVVRVSLSLVILHFLIFLCILPKNRFSVFVNERFFFFKFIMIMVLTFGFLFVDNYYLVFVVKSSTYLSLVFLIIQSVSLIDFGYKWAENWNRKYEEGSKLFLFLTIFMTLLLFALTILVTIFNFQNFWISECLYNMVILIINVIIILTIFIIVLFTFDTFSTFLTTMFITLILTFMNGYSLSSINSQTCNNPASKNNFFIYDTLFHITTNILLAFLSGFFISTSKSTSKKFQQVNLKYLRSNSNSNSLSRSIFQDQDEEMIQYEMQVKFLNTVYYKNQYYLLFHVYCMFFAVYLIMVFFDWREFDLENGKWVQLVKSNTSGFVVKSFNWGVFGVIYFWTLVVPILKGERRNSREFYD